MTRLGGGWRRWRPFQECQAHDGLSMHPMMTKPRKEGWGQSMRGLPCSKHCPKQYLSVFISVWNAWSRLLKKEKRFIQLIVLDA